MFQSTLPRGERLKTQPNDNTKARFQSTLPRGERRPISSACSAILLSFNPRSRVGSDSGSSLSPSEVHLVSIHAPGWGGSHDPKQLKADILVSIHAPAWGATIRLFNTTCKFTKFQSTLPRGERLSDAALKMAQAKFQSTLPRGERLLKLLRCLTLLLFQSTLPRGERLLMMQTIRLFKRFQSTLPRGERLKRGIIFRDKFRSFNPRSRVGSDAKPQ